MIVGLDIETVPTAAALALPYPEKERTPPSNYKSDEAIARWQEADRAKWEEDRIKRYSLNPRYGRVLCTALVDSEGGQLVRYAEDEEGERELLARFVECVRYCVQQGARVWATWNGADFDVRFLMARMAKHETPRRGDALKELHNLYPRGGHADLRRILVGHTPVAGESLDAWAEHFGLVTKPMSGADVYPAWVDGRHDDIARYCAHDAELCVEIATRLDIL